MTSSVRSMPAAGVLRPSTWAEAIQMKAQHPEATPIRGGTDLMVEINFDRARPQALLDLSRVHELDTWETANGGGTVVLGAGVSYTRIVNELHDLLPGLAAAARTVGSPQIRNAGTVGGNLGTASPAGDAHPPLLAARAAVVAESVRGSRTIPIDEFFLGPKRNALAGDELIRSVLVPAATGPRQFAKIGPRNAMVIATTSFAISLDRAGRRVGTGIGSAGPTPLRAAAAEALAEGALSEVWEKPGEPDETVLGEFGRLVAEAASPIDDVRGTADYRRHALRVLGRRLLAWAWSDMREQAGS